MNDTTTPTTTSNRTPSHVAYQVRDREGKKGIWTRIGSAWPHADGNGFNIQIEAVPLDGRIIIRFSHGASSGRKVYRSSFIPGLHDVCMIFERSEV